MNLDGTVKFHTPTPSLKEGKKKEKMTNIRSVSEESRKVGEKLNAEFVRVVIDN